MAVVINSDWGEAKPKDAASCFAAAVSVRTCLPFHDRFIQALDLLKGGKKQPLSIHSIDTDVFLRHELAETIRACISSWGKITTFVVFVVVVCFLDEALGWYESEECCQCQEIMLVSTNWDSGQGCAVTPSLLALWSGGKEGLWGCISTAIGVTK